MINLNALELRRRVTNLGIWSYLWLALGALTVFAIFSFVPATLVGDNSEYFALFLAWSKTARPWMTQIAFEHYNQLIKTGSIPGLYQNLEQFWPQLRVHDTADFIHFWFYSFLAAVVEKPLSWVGLDAPPTSFLLLHSALFFLAMAIALREFGWRGVTTVIALTFFSPVLWYIGRVHTEFFTFCLALCAVMLALRESYVGAALCLAAVSTQNPSFAIVAAFLLAIRFVWLGQKSFQVWEVAAAVSAVLLLMLHPAYYFVRYGIATPQFLTGDARTSADLSVLHVWMIDPDVGLLPNWPLGLVSLMAVAAIWLHRRKNKGRDVAPAFFGANPIFLGFLVVYLVTGLYANSSTKNLNHGAAPVVSRYAIWYIPLFFTAFLSVLTFIKIPAAWFPRLAMGGAVIMLAVFNTWDSWPLREDSYHIYTKPRGISYLIQSKLPQLYNPPPAIFLERYSGFDRDAVQPFAVVGPDCRKILVLPGERREYISNASRCGLDPIALAAALSERRAAIQTPTYLRLPEDETRTRVRYEPGRVYEIGTADVRGDPDGGLVLGDGWSGREPWGVWSDSDVARSYFACPSGNMDFGLSLRLAAFVGATQKPKRVTIKAGGATIWTGDLGPEPVDIALSIPRTACARDVAELEIDIPSPIRASASDTRMLGVAFRQFVYSQ